MASGRIQSTYYGDYSVIITWESVPDVNTNTSLLTMNTYITYEAINISDRTNRTSIAGVEATYRTAPIDTYKGSPMLVNTRSMTVQHNDDGSGSVYIWSQFAFKLNSSSYGRVDEVRAGGWCELDKIPRASKVTLSGGTVEAGKPYVVTVEKAVDNFRHIMTVTFGGYTYTSDVFDTSAEFVVPDEWLSAIPDSSSGTAQVSIQTYSDETCTTAIGSPVETTFDITVPEGAAPIVQDGWATVLCDNTGTAAAAFDSFVQGFSRVRVEFDASKAETRYGATVAAVVAVVEGVNYTEPYLSATLTRSGEQTVRCIITDSRGKQAEQTLKINVEAYASPTLSKISLFRCDSSGTADDAGVYLYAAATVNYSPVGGENFYSLNVRYGANGSSSATTVALESGTGKVVGSGLIAIDRSYTATISVTDGLGRTASYSAVISTADATFNAKPGGKGFAFGKYAEKNNLLDSAWDIHSDGAIAADGDVTSGGKVSGSSGQFDSVSAGSLSADSLTVPEIVASEATLQLKDAGGGVMASLSPDGAAFGAATFGGLVTFNGGVSGLGLRYSETPELTGDTWFDGKPIWRVCKYYTNLPFGGVGQWTNVGVMPIDVTSAQYNLIDFDLKVIFASIFSGGKNCVWYQLPIMGTNGAIASPWMGDGNTINFNWVNTSVKPFDRFDALLVIYFTKNV